MRELPMLMNGHGVRATLDGRKVMTRRPVKDVPPWVTRISYVGGSDTHWMLSGSDWHFSEFRRNPLGVPGDLLYVREKFAIECPYGPASGCDNADHIIYWATEIVRDSIVARWRPSIHMPKWAARLWVRNTGVRVEKGPAISEADAKAEGFESAEAFMKWWAKQYPGMDWRWVTSYEVTKR